MTFPKCKVLEVTTEYICLLLDDQHFYRIDINKTDNVFDIHKRILMQTGNYIDPQVHLSKPFDSVSDIPIKTNSLIDLEHIQQEILQNELSELSGEADVIPNTEEQSISITDLRESAYPTFEQYIAAIYEKEIKNNLDPYKKIINMISDAHELFSDNLGKTLNTIEIEEILNGIAK